MSKYISLLAYRKPAFLHGIGDEKGPPPSPAPEFIVEVIFVLATLRSLESREGGRTMSRSAFVDVVKG
jgi:hypothetical protein